MYKKVIKRLESDKQDDGVFCFFCGVFSLYVCVFVWVFFGFFCVEHSPRWYQKGSEIRPIDKKVFT